MRLDGELAKQLRIPTAGMKPFEVIYKQFKDLLTEVKLTKFYQDDGQLLIDGESKSNRLVYFIQRDDGEFKVVTAGIDGVNAYHILKQYLDPEIKAVVIACYVPSENVKRFEQQYLNSDYGALEFIAQHHPSGEARVKAISLLNEMVDHEKDNPGKPH